MKTNHAMLLIASILGLFAVMTLFIDFFVGIGIAGLAALFYAAAAAVTPDKEIDG